MAQPLLFHGISIHDLLRAQQEELKVEVRQLSASDFDRLSEDALVAALAAKYKLELPVPEFELASQAHRDIQVDVSGDPMRMVFAEEGPVYVHATEITVGIPFKGDPRLFEVQPSSFTLNPPRGELSNNEVSLRFVLTHTDPAELRREYDRAVASIKQYLGWMETDIVRFNSRIGGEVQTLVSQRSTQLHGSAELAASLGLPSRAMSARPAEARSQASIRRTVASPKKWDVFICHASEDKKGFVGELARALQDVGLQVWYDEFSLKIGDSLRRSIDFGVANSRYGIVVLSEAFFHKSWPQTELDGLVDREIGGRKVVLPIWHKIDHEGVAKYSATLAGRLAAKSSDGPRRVVEQILAAVDESA